MNKPGRRGKFGARFKQGSGESREDVKPNKQKPAPAQTESGETVKAEAYDGWLIQTPPGLAKIAQKEMGFAGAIQREQKVFVKLQRNHDLIFVGRAKSDEAFAKLRIPEMILRCPAYGRFKISKTQLGILAEELKKVGPRRLVVQIAGRQFERNDLQRFLFREIEARGYEFDPDVEDEAWMFCIDENWYFGLPVSKAREAKGREERSEERRGSLPPPIAAALAFSCHPREDDVVLDPTCGSGTLLAELHAYAPTAKLVGCDVDANAVAIARQNLNVTGAQIENRDARSLEDAKFSLTLANLPFGKQFGSKETNLELYRSLIEKCAALRAPGSVWRGVFLTSDTEAFEKALSKQFASEVLFKVKIRGELATAFRLKMHT